tara:strand:+ start:11782 stop:13215 length:1434 start_codon:yes stop_codon:yes gene_type:complete
MADKLLILGAAMAHANKSYNISSSITKAVDKSLKGYVSMIQAQQKRIGNASILTQSYLDKLPENPEIELLDENLAKTITSELNDIRNTIGKLNMDRFADPYKYAPGTQEYINITSELKKQEKLLTKRLTEAKTLQTAKANWIKEHPNISETWKLLHADKYIALGQILNKENPNYETSRNKDGELILSTMVEGKKIDIKVDELDDWEQYPLPEINKINEFYELANTTGTKGVDIPNSTLNNMKIYLNNFIGENENALFSLMFDDLPIGDPNNKMPFFTNEELVELFDTDSSGDFDPSKDDWKSKYDFKDMREKVVNRIIERVQEENKRAKPEEVGYFNNPDDSSTERKRKNEMANNTTRLIDLLQKSKNMTVNEIAQKIVKDSYLSAFISEEASTGTVIMPDKTTVTDMTIDSFDIKDLIVQFKKDGNVTPLIEKLMKKLGAKKSDRNAVYTDLYHYDKLSEDHILKQIKISGELRPK